MKDIVIFDLDGTLADCSRRLHYINPPSGIDSHKKDWRGFFAACGTDQPIEHVISINQALKKAGYEIWIVSGRSDECKDLTVEWLYTYGVKFDKMIMRKAGDYTDDSTLKPSWVIDGTIPADRVLCVFDDRNRVVDAWRALGIPCFHVADGDF